MCLKPVCLILVYVVGMNCSVLLYSGNYLSILSTCPAWLFSCPLTAHTLNITHTSPPLPLFGQHTLWSHNLYFLTENTLANWPIVFFLGTGATFSRWQGTYVAWPLTGTARAPSLGFPWPNPPYLSLSFHTIHLVLVRWNSCYPMQHGQ